MIATSCQSILKQPPSSQAHVFECKHRNTSVRVIALTWLLDPQKQSNRNITAIIHVHHIHALHITSITTATSSITMGATLSPFRYAQVAKYALQRWLDQTPNVVKSTWKGKGRATPVVTATPTGSRQASGSSSSSSSSGSEESDVSPGANSGPSSSTKPESPDLSGRSPSPSNSRYKLQPDSRMPPQPTEIYRLMNDERLLEPGRRNAPKEIIVLCHGELLSPRVRSG